MTTHGVSGWRLVVLLTALVMTVLVVAPFPVAAALAALPSVERSSPAVTGLEPGRIDVFWRASSGRLAHRYQPAGGSWTRQLDLGGALASQPAAVSWAPGRIDVVARGTDNTLQHRWYAQGSGWSSWRSRGSGLTSQPAIAAPGQGLFDIAARRSGAATRRCGSSGTSAVTVGAAGRPWAGRWRPGRRRLRPATTCASRPNAPAAGSLTPCGAPRPRRGAPGPASTRCARCVA